MLAAIHRGHSFKVKNYTFGFYSFSFFCSIILWNLFTDDDDDGLEVDLKRHSNILSFIEGSALVPQPCFVRGRSMTGEFEVLLSVLGEGPPAQAEGPVTGGSMYDYC